MLSKSKRLKDSESKQSLDKDIEPKDHQASKQQSKDIEMDDELNSDVEMDFEQNDDTDLDLKDGTKADASKKSKPKHVKKGVCVKCNETKTITRCSMCDACYRKHLKSKHEQEGRQESKRLIICLKCNSLKKHRARNLCQDCYESVRKDPENLKQYSKKLVKSCKSQQGSCVKCNEQKTFYRSFMCRSCYDKEIKERHKAGAQKCGNCGRLKVLEQNEFCSDCNSDERIKEVANKQKLEAILKSIQENELIASASLTIHSCLATNAKCFEKYGKIKINFSNFGNLSNSAGLDKNGKNSGLSKYSISNEDFVNRLKQYTSSKLKPLKKHNKPMDTKNASSIFDVEKEEPAKSSSKVKQPSKIKTPTKPKKFILKECVDCKQMKPHHARDRCSPCYSRFMRQKKKEDAEKAKTAKHVEKESSQNVEVQNDNLDQAEVPSDKSKKKRAKKQSSDD